MATRARGCHAPASSASARTSIRSPPIASSPCAPIHQSPGSCAAGVTCGLATRKFADSSAIALAIAMSSHSKIVSVGAARARLERRHPAAHARTRGGARHRAQLAVAHERDERIIPRRRCVAYGVEVWM